MSQKMHPMVRNSKKDDVTVLRHTYDIGIGLEKRGGHCGCDMPMQVHLRGEGESTLLRLAMIGGAVLVGTVIVCAVKCVHTRLHYAARYRQKYARQYEKKIQRLQKHAMRKEAAACTGDLCR
ncbi:MAG: hypothetical protein IJC98_07875 [Clostridia bacterium]|nr:hypothetical protein [Clostridia bacterium]